MLANAFDSSKAGHSDARRIVRREHFKVAYERSPADVRVNPEAGRAIFDGLRHEFGAEYFRHDRYQQSSGAPDFPVRLRNGEIASSLERDSVCLNRKGDSRGDGFLIQDAGWGWGPASMARPYSIDLRDRVVASVGSGRTCRATAALFGVSVSSVVKWSQRFRRTGSAAAYWMGGHRRRVLAGERDWLLARLAEKPDLTLRALVAELVERGVPASYGAVWRLLKAEGITVKKKPVRRRAGSP